MEEYYFKDLDWNSPKETQEKAISEFVSMVNLNPIVLVQPYGKEYWENSALILCKIGFPGIENAIPYLFNWLQDINWPGSLTIMKLLKSLPKNSIIRHLETAASQAYYSSDEIWLSNLATFIDSFELHESDFISNEIFTAMLLSDKLD